MKLFFVFLIIGFFINYIFPSVGAGVNFSEVSIILLVIGLYASVYEIDTHILNKHKQLLLSALTLGVLFKAIFIGTILFLITQSSFAFLLGIVVAQIDPLSVSHLLQSKDKSFSKVGRTILRVWSSFDDPMTILLSLFFVGPFVLGTFFSNPFSYLTALGENLFFALLVFVFTRYLFQKKAEKVILGVCVIVCIVFNLTLGIALIALFLRPKLGNELSYTVKIAFYIGVLLLGLTLELTIGGIFFGILLGILGYISQIFATLLIARKLSARDKIHLALAQYNGITSIGLGIFFSAYFPSITSIIAVAVITINSCYYFMNNFLGKKLFAI